MAVDEESGSVAVGVDLDPDERAPRRAAGRTLRFDARRPTVRRAAPSTLPDGPIR